MLILALESSAKPASVAVYMHESEGCGKLLGQNYRNDGFSHSRTLLAMVQSLLNDLNLKPSDIDLVAAANGPGSFTGVRIGVSAAKGFAFGLDIPVCGVSTLEAMAYQTTAGSINTLICPVMDARRGQVYNAVFKYDSHTLIRLREDRAIPADELEADLKTLGAMPGDVLYVKDQSAFGVALASLHAQHAAASQLEPVYLRPSQAEREMSERLG